MNTAELLPAQDDQILRLAVAAHLARYKGQTRAHTASDLNTYLSWCRDHGLEPLGAKRAHIELFLRWMQEVRRLKPSTVSRRLSVLSGFYRTCLIDEVLEHSPAEYVRGPRVAPESPALGLSHLQFEAMLTAARDSSNVNDFALVAMLGLLGLRIFEATGADIEALSEVRGHRVLRVHGKGDKIALVPLPPAVSRAIDRSLCGQGLWSASTVTTASTSSGRGSSAGAGREVVTRGCGCSCVGRELCGYAPDGYLEPVS
jgi:integrase/recombinase XerD